MNAERWLPGVPGDEIEKSLSDAAERREIAPRQNAPPRIDSKISSSALVMNAFGFFFERPADIPPLPGYKISCWTPSKLMFEKPLNFPWRGGRHPELDVVISTKSVVVGIESKRYEPLARKNWTDDPFDSPKFWEPQWWEGMTGYKAIRNDYRLFTRLDAPQLVKHALGLRARVQRYREFYGRRPALFYLYAEPEKWANDGKAVDAAAVTRHQKEVAAFKGIVAKDAVQFIPGTYRQLLAVWQNDADPEIVAHAARVLERFAP